MPGFISASLVHLVHRCPHSSPLNVLSMSPIHLMSTFLFVQPACVEQGNTLTGTIDRLCPWIPIRSLFKSWTQPTLGWRYINGQRRRIKAKSQHNLPKERIMPQFNSTSSYQASNNFPTNEHNPAQSHTPSNPASHNNVCHRILSTGFLTNFG